MMIPPSICINNLDMDQRMHDTSVGHWSHTFWGTWGYIHLPNANFIKLLDQSKLTLGDYHNEHKES
jgi:hypothetical protein